MIKFRHLLHLAALSASFLATAQLPANEQDRPNILWIIAEDMSPDLGCYGNKVVTTPNIDQLATKGMKFNRAFTTAPACSPSRTALATGVYQTTLGAHHMRYPKALTPDLPKSVKILPELMRELGYSTGNIKGICGTGKGKDDWQFNVPGKSWDTSSWEQLIKKQPFFAQIHSSKSHRSFSSSKGIAKGKIKIPPYYPDHSVSRSDWAGYFADINNFDEQVGAILKQLETDHLAKNTIVCVFSDHGRPMIRGKNWLYDSGTRIPLVIYFPDGVKKPGRYQARKENSELLSAIDLVAETVLMGGGTVPDWMQGRSFLRTKSQPRQYIHTAIDRVGNIDSCSRAVRNKRYKYIRNFKTPGSINDCTTAYRRASHPIYHLLNIMGEKDLLTPVQTQLLKPMAKEELYDLENDPYEMVNLIGNKNYEAVHKELKSRMDKWIKTSNDKGFEPDSEAILEHFREYGATTFKMRSKTIQKMRLWVERNFE